MKIIKSYLPVFQGFYGTFFDSDQSEDTVLEKEDLQFDDVEFDHKEYRNRVAEKCVSSVWNFLKNDGFEIDIEFEEVYSPRQYNFTNDVINCTYKITDADFNKLLEYCKTNLSDFKTFLEDNYSSYSGFISFFATEPKKWFNEYLKEDSDKFERAFEGILEFYLENENYVVDDMLSDVQEELNIINYKILTE